MSGLKSHNFISAEERRRRELERKRKEHERMLNKWQEEEEKYLTKQKRIEQKISKDLLTKEASNIKEETYNPTITKSSTKKKKDTKESIKQKIEETLNMLKEFNTNAYQKKSKDYKNIQNASLNKLEFFYMSLKLDIQEYKKEFVQTKAYKRSIQDLIQDVNLNTQAKTKVTNFLNSQTISKQEYEKIFAYIEEQITKQEQNKDIDKIVQALKDLDYFVIDNPQELKEKLSNKEKVMLSIGSSDYKVVTLYNNNELITRFVRVSNSLEQDISSSQKIEDSEKLKEWCSVQRELHKHFQEIGLESSLNVLEDEESDIVYVVDRESSKSSKEEAIYGQQSK